MRVAYVGTWAVQPALARSCLDEVSYMAAE